MSGASADETPQGFTRIEREGAVLVLRDGFADTLLEAGIHDPQGLVTRSPSALVGRGRLARIDLGPAGRAIVRPLLRGGLLGKLVRRVSLDPWRALSELRVSTEAAARGAIVLDVLAAISRPGAIGWQHGLVTREVEGAVDLAAALRAWPEGPARWRALRAAGTAIRRLHDAGVDHVDLNLKNVLLDPRGKALVIDLDRCRLGPDPATFDVRARNLIRLLRSWTKLGVLVPGSTCPRDPLRLLHAYSLSPVASPVTRDDRALERRLLALGRDQRFGCRRVAWRCLRGPA